MSYEGEMLQDLKMPTRKEVEQALLKTLFRHNGTVKEFSTGEEIVNEIANEYENTLDPKFQQFKKRMKMQRSPVNLSMADSTFWQTLCVYCLNYSTGKSKDLAIKRLNHEKFCHYKAACSSPSPGKGNQ